MKLSVCDMIFMYEVYVTWPKIATNPTGLLMFYKSEVYR